MEDNTIELIINEIVETVIDPIVETVIDPIVETVIDPNVDNHTFDFISNPIKLELLSSINETLNINKFPHKKLIFVYSGPKVGSTSIVSSLRIFGTDKFSVIHIHDEEMLKVLGHVNGITVNEIILYNKYLGKDIYVIDVYRSPIERKISAYFEKIGAYHFNNTDENINKYNVKKVIRRFNKIIPYLANGDHFIDKYNIEIPERFDNKNQYLLVEKNGIKYIKLRLKDASSWGAILTNILGTRICMIKDYESKNKAIKDIYMEFKSMYKIPGNVLEEIMECKYLKYYYSEEEQIEYLREWRESSTEDFNSYTEEEYKIYEEVTMENSNIENVQLHHYMDEGCNCKACEIKRKETSKRIMKGMSIRNEDKVLHEEARSELIKKRVESANKINALIRSMPLPQEKRGKDFKREMRNIVNGKSRI